jgi:hypothetical protein
MRAAMLALVLAAGGCQGSVEPGAQPPSAGASPTATATLTPSPTPATVDPLVTVEVCGLANAATATTTTVFNEQIAAFEQAAAQNDQAALVAAAKAMNEQFQSAAEAFTQLSERHAGPELQLVLTQIAAALTAMSSVSYTGTTVDIRKKLVDFTLALEAACGSATVPPSGGSD